MLLQSYVVNFVTILLQQVCIRVVNQENLVSSLIFSSSYIQVVAFKPVNNLAESMQTLELVDSLFTNVFQLNRFYTYIRQFANNTFLNFCILSQFNDVVYESRLNSQKAIEMLSHTSNGQDGIVEAGLIPILVEKLLEENDEIKVVQNFNQKIE